MDPVMLSTCSATDLRWHSRNNTHHSGKNCSHRRLLFKLNSFVFILLFVCLFPSASASTTTYSKCSGWPADTTLYVCFAVESIYNYNQYSSHLIAAKEIISALRNNATGTAAGKLIIYRYDRYRHRRNSSTGKPTIRDANLPLSGILGNPASVQERLTTTGFTPVISSARNTVVGKKLTSLRKCGSVLRSFGKSKSRSRSNSNTKNTHTVIVSMSDQFVDRSDVKNLLRDGHFVFGVQDVFKRVRGGRGGGATTVKWMNSMKQITSEPGVRKFKSPPSDWKKLADYFAWYVTQLMMSKDGKPCYSYTPFSSSTVVPFNPSTAGGSANNSPPPGVTPLVVPSETDEQSTNRLVGELQRVPFRPPKIQDINDIAFSSSWTKEQNAVAVRDAIEFLIFEELGGEFVNDTFSNPMIKSAVTVVDASPAYDVPIAQRMGNNQVIVNSCHSNNCAAKVLVRSNERTSSAAIDRAVAVLRTRNGYRDVFNDDPSTITRRVVHRKNQQNVWERYWELKFQYLQGGSSSQDA